jgi:predicted molibdopterin-dependent oxidoreductase YjgC
MARIKIDNIECDVPDGATILEAALSVGIKIPTLCHKDGLPHYSSCMVCLVKDNRSNGFIPSCSALVQPGMDIDASGNNVILIRKKAVELLLSEHRAECDAPCRVVCPAGYNIPLLNRMLSENKIEEAVKLTLSEIDSNEIRCVNCPAYCENACRRKKVDTSISIRNLKLFIAFKNRESRLGSSPPDFPIDQNETDSKNKPVLKQEKKRFRSLIGKLEQSELLEWVKECGINEPRFIEISDKASAFSEAKSCMHCDCRAADDCRLRNISDDFGLKNPSGKLVYAPISKKINLHNNLIFENAKCIKCGLCVRICEDKTDEPQLCFINRGFVSILSEPLTNEFVETMKSTAKECIEVCPTGALSFFK